MKTYNKHIFDSFKSQVEDAVDHQGQTFQPAARSTWLIFFKFLTIIRPYWGKVALIILVVCASRTMAVVWPWMGKILIDDALPNRDWRLFWVLVGARMGLIGFSWFLWRLNQIFIRYIDLRVFGDLQSRFFDHLIRLSMTFMQNRPTGEHIFRASSDVWGVMFMITDLLPQLLEAVYEFFLIMILLTYVDWRVMLIVFVYMVPYTMLVHWITTYVRKFDREARMKWQRSDAILQDGVAGKMVVKTFARRQHEVKKYLTANVDAWRTQIKRRYTFILKGQLAGNWGFIPWIMNWGLRAWFFREAILGHITYGSLFPIFAYMNRFRNPFQRIVELVQRLRVSMVPAERIMQTLDVAPVVTNKPGAPDMPPLQGKVEFQDVHFNYEQGVPVLQGLTFGINTGQRVAFVGHSGAGKSTILNLLLRLYDPQSGRVLLDDTDIRDVRMESLQQQVGLVFQDTFLFIGSIRDNILFAKTKATDEQIWEALREAELDEFVRSLPDGLDTDLHEGTSLSGGQKQRLGIARAMVRNPQLLILDEPTSSLDSDTESRLLDTLHKVMQGRTTIIISHRLPTVIDADVIYAMDEGRVVEAGTHQQLLAKNGYYAQLYTTYFAGKHLEDDDEEH